MMKVMLFSNATSLIVYYLNHPNLSHPPRMLLLLFDSDSMPFPLILPLALNEGKEVAGKEKKNYYGIGKNLRWLLICCFEAI
jgi:hypothetical protein